MQYPLSFEKPLKKHSYKGLYISIEGIDGSGKTTQVERLKGYFENKGRKVTTTSEPMPEGPIQEIIRGALSSRLKIPTKAYQFLYSADRVVNHNSIVEPALKKGSVVLTHRSFWSAVAYGILDRGEDYSFSQKAWQLVVAHGILSSYHQFIKADITFYLKVSARKAVERLRDMSKIKDSYEKEEKLAKIVYGYDMLVAKFPEEFVVIDGENSEEEVTEEIVKTISSIVNKT